MERSLCLDIDAGSGVGTSRTLAVEPTELSEPAARLVLSRFFRRFCFNQLLGQPEGIVRPVFRRPVSHHDR